MDLREGFPLPLEHVAPLAGKIAAPAPSSIGDPVFVTLDSLYQADQPFKHGPLKWNSGDATSLPSVGDACVVVELDTGELWVIAWEGSSPIPGGGPITDHERLHSPSTTPVGDGSSAYMSWEHVSGSSLLDLSAPTDPVILTSGIYAVSVTVFPSDAMTVGGAFAVVLLFDGGSIAAASEGSGRVAIPGEQFVASVSLTHYIPAGKTIRAQVGNNDGASTIEFGISRAHLQRIT